MKGLCLGLVGVLTLASCGSDLDDNSDEVGEADQAITGGLCTAITLTAPAINSTGTVGTPITITATATCPGTPEYQFWVKQSTVGNWTVVSGAFSTDPSFAYPFPSAGTWNITAVVRNQGNAGYDKRANSRNVIISAAPVNQAPTANADTASTAKNTAISISPLANDTDPENDTLTLTGVGTASLGTASVAPGNTISYLPAPGVTGVDTFTYTVSDGQNPAVTGSVQVTITNTAPTAPGTTLNTTPSVDVTINPGDVCADADGDALSFSGFGAATNGTVSAGAGGSIVYRANAAFDGTDSFTFDCTDGAATASGTVNVNVVDGAPVANDDTVSTHNGGDITGILVNDTDPDGDAVSFHSGSGSTTAGGFVSFNGTNITYTPPAGFSGSDSFTYDVTDGTKTSNAATVAITVGNTAPTATDDAFTTPGNTPLTVVAPGLLANDSDADGDAVAVTGAGSASNGALSVNADGAFTYTPNTSFQGQDSFTYSITDGHGGTASATVTISVGTQPPTATDDSYTGNQNTTIAFTPSLTGNDTDPNNNITGVTAVSALDNPAAGTLTVNADGTGTFVPTASFVGTVHFTYQAIDSDSNVSNTATVTITVNAVSAGCTISISGPTSGVFGQTFTLTATASCTTGTAEIRWFRKIGTGATTQVQGYSTATTFDYTPSALGNHTFTAEVRTVGTTTPTTLSNAVVVNVVDNVATCTGVKLTAPANLSTAAAGSMVTMTAVATCPAGTTAEYQYWFKTGAGNYTIVNSAFVTGSVIWNVPLITGPYDLKVVARAVGAHVGYQVASNSIRVNVQ